MPYSTRNAASMELYMDCEDDDLAPCQLAAMDLAKQLFIKAKKEIEEARKKESQWKQGVRAESPDDVIIVDDAPVPQVMQNGVHNASHHQIPLPVQNISRSHPARPLMPVSANMPTLTRTLQMAGHNQFHPRISLTGTIVPGTNGMGFKRTAGAFPVFTEQPAKKKQKRKSPLEVREDDATNWVPLEEFYYGKKAGDPSYREEKGQFRFKCWYCHRMLYNNLKIMAHMQGHIDSEKQQNLDLMDLTQCKQCYRQFDTPFEMQCHMEKVHQNTDNVLVCRICEKEHDNDSILRQHMRQSHNACEMPYVCLLCNFRSSIYTDVVDHFKKRHDSSQNVMCLYCLKVFKINFSKANGWGLTQNYYQHLQRHQVKHAGKRCPCCKLTFLNKQDLKLHRQNHHQPNHKGILGSAATGNVLSEQGAEQVMIRLTDNAPKSLNAPTTAKIKEFRGLQMPGYAKSLLCHECKKPMGQMDHYKRYIECSMCRYATMCTFAYAKHMLGYHTGSYNPMVLTIPEEKPLVQPMFCWCGYSTSYGNCMANHLVSCSKRTCYSNKPDLRYIEYDEDQEDFNPFESFADEPDLPDKQEPVKEERSLFDVLGLVKRREPNADSGKKMRAKEKPQPPPPPPPPVPVEEIPPELTGARKWETVKLKSGSPTKYSIFLGSGGSSKGSYKRKSKETLSERKGMDTTKSDPSKTEPDAADSTVKDESISEDIKPEAEIPAKPESPDSETKEKSNQNLPESENGEMSGDDAKAENPDSETKEESNQNFSESENGAASVDDGKEDNSDSETKEESNQNFSESENGAISGDDGKADNSDSETKEESNLQNFSESENGAASVDDGKADNSDSETKEESNQNLSESENGEMSGADAIADNPDSETKEESNQNFSESENGAISGDDGKEDNSDSETKEESNLNISEPENGEAIGDDAKVESQDSEMDSEDKVASDSMEDTDMDAEGTPSQGVEEKGIEKSDEVMESESKELEDVTDFSVDTNDSDSVAESTAAPDENTATKIETEDEKESVPDKNDHSATELEKIDAEDDEVMEMELISDAAEGRDSQDDEEKPEDIESKGDENLSQNVQSESEIDESAKVLTKDVEDDNISDDVNENEGEQQQQDDQSAGTDEATNSESLPSEVTANIAEPDSQEVPGDISETAEPTPVELTTAANPSNGSAGDAVEMEQSQDTVEDISEKTKMDNKVSGPSGDKEKTPAGKEDNSIKTSSPEMKETHKQTRTDRDHHADSNHSSTRSPGSSSHPREQYTHSDSRHRERSSDYRHGGSKSDGYDSGYDRNWRDHSGQDHRGDRHQQYRGYEKEDNYRSRSGHQGNYHHDRYDRYGGGYNQYQEGRDRNRDYRDHHNNQGYYHHRNDRRGRGGYQGGNRSYY